jgi:hypothetical protein
MHYKGESSITPLVSKARLFPAGWDSRACCDRSISPEDSEDVIDFTIFTSFSGFYMPGLLFQLPVDEFFWLFISKGMTSIFSNVRDFTDFSPVGNGHRFLPCWQLLGH